MGRTDQRYPAVDPTVSGATGSNLAIEAFSSPLMMPLTLFPPNLMIAIMIATSEGFLPLHLLISPNNPNIRIVFNVFNLFSQGQMDLITTIISNLHETPPNHAHISNTEQLFTLWSTSSIKPMECVLNMHKLKSFLQLFATQMHAAD